MPTFGQDAVKLEWKYEKNKPFYQEMTTKTEQDMKVMGMTIKQEQNQTFYFSWTPIEEKDKVWTIKQKIEGLKMEIKIGNTPISYDSTKEGGGANNPLGDFFKVLVGAEFTLTVGPDMKVKEIKGKEEFLKKLVQTNQMMENLLRQILSDDALKQMADPAFGVIPGKEVKKGESWTKTSTLNMGPIGTYDSNLKYTYEGKDDKDKNLDKIKVETDLKYKAPTAAPAGGPLPFKIISADLKSKEATGSILFDAAKGRLANSKMNMKLEGKLSIDISGMTSEVELTQAQTTEVKTSDQNPVAKPAEKPAS
jgi:hypothetical protein